LPVGTLIWLHFDEDADGLQVLVHPATVESEQLLQWRLLLPLGTVFRTHANLILDDGVSRLDRGFVLA
jgi:hypothetical protein